MTTATAKRGPPLIVAALCAPLTGVSLRRPNLLHAVTMEGVIKAWPDHCAVAACGTRNIRLLLVGRLAVEWPPKIRSLPDRVERCRACWEATGRMRPRSQFTHEIADGVVA